MNAEEWAQVEELYLEACGLEPEELGPFLARLDEGLRGEVESLLEADRLSGGFLEEPPGLLAADLLDRAPDQLVAGDLVDGYRVEALVTVGEMGEVYRAYDVERDAAAGLKVLRRHLLVDPFAEARFEREARAAQALAHRNLVKVYELGESPVGLYLAMEWVDGVTFRELLDGGVASFGEAVEWAKQAAEGVAAAHAEGVIHRDIKPENIMLRCDGVVKILDFGLAKRTGQRSVDPEGWGASGTISGTLSGTLPYMSPEVLWGEAATSASDVFSLASVMYELFTGKHPFAGETPLDVFEAIEGKTPSTPSSLRPELPLELDGLLLRMLERTPSSRPSAAEVAASLIAISTKSSAH